MEIVFKRMAPYIKTSYDSKAKLMTFDLAFNLKVK